MQILLVESNLINKMKGNGDSEKFSNMQFNGVKITQATEISQNANLCFEKNNEMLSKIIKIKLN